MSDFTDRIDDILFEKDITRSEMYKELKFISPLRFYDWKTNGTIPNTKYTLEIAKFLDTTVEYLVTGKDENPYYKKYIEYKSKLDKIYALTKDAQSKYHS